MRIHVAALSLILVAGVAHARVWGDGSFENDDAIDWAVECTSAKSIGPISRALSIASKGKSIEAADGSAAVAAAEVVAAALGHPGPKMPKQLRDWMNRQSTEQLIALAPNARAALARVANPEISELAQSWSEGKPGKWQESIADLQARLQQQ